MTTTEPPPGSQPSIREVCTVACGRSRVLDWGGDGPPVVLLHPNGFCAGLYEPIARQLRAHARPIAIDLRGHGGSSKPTDAGSYRFELLAADVVAVLDELGFGSVACVGGSLGGGVAVLVDRLDPGRWTRLLLAEAVAFPPTLAIPTRDNPMAAAARRRRRTFASRREMYENYRQKEPLSQLAPEALDAYLRWGTRRDRDGVHLACPPEVEATIFEISATPDGAPDAWDHLDRLSCPTTVVSGRGTFLPGIFDAQAARAGAESVSLPGGHFVLHEDTARGAGLIHRYALG